MVLQVKRSDLEDWIKHPHLHETLLGAVVRVALGAGRGGDSGYSMCLVQDVTEGKRYTCAACSASLAAS